MKNFLKNEAGVTAIEYALIGGAVGGGLAIVRPALFAAVKNTFGVTFVGYFT